MKIYAVDNRELMDISEIVPQGSSLLLRGKLFGTMPVAAKLTPGQARAALKLMNARTILFFLTLLFRRD